MTRQPRPGTAERRLAAAADAALTYPEVGSTRGELPPGYHHVHRQLVIGSGARDFDRAADALLGWRMHRDAGLVVHASAPRARTGVVTVLGVGVGRARIWAPCRVVYEVDDARRRGFAYGTLPGHPEAGEERFVVEHGTDGDVVATITAFSRPATWSARVGAPVNRLAQRLVTGRYLRALASAAR